MKIASALVALASLAALAAPARAQAVEAEVLFRDGKNLIKAGKLAEGCDKLDASARLESSVGTLLNLGDCREKLGQHATAWAVFQKAAAAAKVANDSKREAEARRREKLLEAKLSYVTIVVPDAVKLPGLVVARNGKALDSALWSQSIPIDPGDYEITAEAPAHDKFSKHLRVEAGGFRATVEIPKLAAPGGAKPVLVPVATTSEPTATEPQPEPERPAPAPSPPILTNTRRLALASDALGLVAIAGGVYFGLHANDLEKQSDALCSGTTCTDKNAVQLNSDARSNGTYSTVAFAVGGAAIIGGTVLWFVGAPKDVAVTPAVAGDRVGLSFAGRF